MPLLSNVIVREAGERATPDRLVGTLTGMGVDRAEVIRAGTSSGFEVITADEWPGWDHYVVVFEKPLGSPSKTQ